MAIPKIIHQIYFEGWDAIPAETRASVERLRDLNPDWDYRLHDAHSAETFLRNLGSQEIASAYARIDPRYYAARADLLRYLLCLHHGGVYLDIKSTATIPLDQVIRSGDSFLISQWAEYRGKPGGLQPAPEIAHIPGGEFVNWFVVSEPDHPLLSAVIDRVLANIDDYRPFTDGVGKPAVLRLTGPIAYTLAMAPLLGVHPHRRVHHDDELGFRFSIHVGHDGHEKVYGRHYSTLSTPVVRQSRPVTAAARLRFGFVGPALRVAGWKFDGARRRLRRLVGLR